MVVRTNVCFTSFTLEQTTLTLFYNGKLAVVVFLLLFAADNDYLLHGKVNCCQENPVIISFKGLCAHEWEGSNYE